MKAYEANPLNLQQQPAAGGPPISLKQLAELKQRLSPAEFNALREQYLRKYPGARDQIQRLDAMEKYLSVVDQFKSRDICSTVNCCELGRQDCALSALPSDELTLIFPGGETRCLFSTSRDYAFQVF